SIQKINNENNDLQVTKDLEKIDDDINVVIKEFEEKLNLYGFKGLKNIVLYNKNYEFNFIRSSVEEIIKFCYFQNIVDFYNHINLFNTTKRSKDKIDYIRNRLQAKIVDLYSITNLSESKINELLFNEDFFKK
ncbi:hypothetical protein, partial [Candidatus Phytoplasma prunorum]